MIISTSYAMGTAAHNSSNVAQQATLVLKTATIEGINSLFETGSAVLSRSAELILETSYG